MAIFIEHLCTERTSKGPRSFCFYSCPEIPFGSKILSFSYQKKKSQVIINRDSECIPFSKKCSHSKKNTIESVAVIGNNYQVAQF